MAMILAARDGGLGLGAAGDVTPWLRIGGGVGGFALGTVGTRWMAATVGARVLETGPETGFRLRLLPTAGVARLTAHDSQSDGPGPSSRETLAATTTVELDATRFGPAPALTLRVAGGALWALSQSRTGEGGSTFSRGYSAGWLLSLGAGVAF